MNQNPNEWADAERIANLPAVHEVIQGFAEDPTGANGTMIVREVLRALAAPSPVAAAAPHGGDLQTLLTVFDMGLGFALCHRDFGGTRNAIKQLQADFAEIRAAIAKQLEGDAS